MANLINGNGNLAIYAEQDSDFFAAVMGNTTGISDVGHKFSSTLLDANTIGVNDGVIVTKEGRRIQLDANEIDDFEIPNGAQGSTNYYIIGYQLVTDASSAQTCQTFVELMEGPNDTIPENTFRDGADTVYVSLYRVTQVDLTITNRELLLPYLHSVGQLNADLTANGSHFYFDYKNGEYGFNTSEQRGADTFSPFNSKAVKLWDIGSQTGYDIRFQTFTMNCDSSKFTHLIFKCQEQKGSGVYHYLLVPLDQANINVSHAIGGYASNGWYVRWFELKEINPTNIKWYVSDSLFKNATSYWYAVPMEVYGIRFKSLN